MIDYSEMLPADIFTRPRQPWQAKVEIKHFLSDEELTTEQLMEKGKQIATILRRCSRFHDEDVILRFEGDIDDMDEFNYILSDMYDECDSARIWVK